MEWEKEVLPEKSQKGQFWSGYSFAGEKKKALKKNPKHQKTKHSQMGGNKECSQALTVNALVVKSTMSVSKQNLKTYMVTKKC